MAGEHHRLGPADRRPRGSDRRGKPAPQAGPRRPSLRPALDERPGIGWVLAFTIAAEMARSSASQAPRSSPATPGSAPGWCSRATPIAAARSQSTAPAICAGRCSRGPCTPSSTPPTRSATSETGSGSASSAAPRSPRSTSPAGSPTRFGTCFLETSPSLQEAPLFVWRPDRPFGLAPASEHPISPVSLEEAIQT